MKKVATLSASICAGLLVGCAWFSPTALPTPVNLATSGGAQEIITPEKLTPSLTPTLVVTEKPLPSYKVIDEKNVGQLELLNQWEVENVFFRSTVFWFSDSNQFIVPASKASMDGIQSFKVANFAATWFAQTDSSEATIVANDQVIAYRAGLLVFNKQGVEIQTSKANCEEGSSSDMINIPGTNLIVTGHQHYGDITNSYGTSRLLEWDESRNSCKDLLKEFVGRLSSLSVSYDGRYISYSAITSTVDTASGELVGGATTHIFDMNDHKEICRMVGLIAKFNQQNLLVIYDKKQGVISLVTPSDCTTQKKNKVGTDLKVLTFNPTGDILAGSSGLTVEFWSTKSGKKIGEIDLEASLTNRPLLGFSPDGRFLVTTKFKTSSTEEDQVMLWGIPGK